MTDALAAMVQMESVAMAGLNKERELQGWAIAHTCETPAGIKLHEELERRGVL